MSRKGEMLFVCCSALIVLGARAEMSYFAHQGKLRTVVMIGEGKSVGTGTVAKIDEMADKKFGDSWNLQFSGVMNVAAAGKYEFAVTSDDGSALFVDGNAVVMNDGLHGPANRKGTLDLAAGKHQVNLLYFNNNG
ncbi:MAG TPA: PA14 domain-containing protein, partial [Kiritimatiellia bacterium]|nr:PA14 domain-containing protein [Kiritimatiellia bacterium]